MLARTRAAALAAALSTALAIGMAGTTLAADDVDSGDLTYREDAQLALVADPSGPNGLDGTRAVGVACESPPSRADIVTTTPPATPTPAAPVTRSRCFPPGTPW